MHSSTRENYCASQENSTFQENYLSPTWDEGRVDQGTRPVVLWKKVCFSSKTKQTLVIVACAMNDKAARSCTGNLVAAGNDRVPLTHKNSVKRCRLSAPSPHKRTWASTAHLQKHDNIHEELPPKRLRPPYFQMSKACMVRNSRGHHAGGKPSEKALTDTSKFVFALTFFRPLSQGLPQRIFQQQQSFEEDLGIKVETSEQTRLVPVSTFSEAQNVLHNTAR